ncbi:Uncharacterised protein [Actinomyces viscosus]|uniref:Uncharacterized protein n=1 Tax=Actinomyces viscosus TaxID=1656 RepID=A0A3S4VKF7_ACTVI|nr:Uncharacterised protein [Actinomyces viscosus]
MTTLHGLPTSLFEFFEDLAQDNSTDQFCRFRAAIEEHVTKRSHEPLH